MLPSTQRTRARTRSIDAKNFYPSSSPAPRPPPSRANPQLLAPRRVHRRSVTAAAAGISFVLQKARRKRGASNNVRRCSGYFASDVLHGELHYARARVNPAADSPHPPKKCAIRTRRDGNVQRQPRNVVGKRSTCCSPDNAETRQKQLRRSSVCRRLSIWRLATFTEREMTN